MPPDIKKVKNEANVLIAADQIEKPSAEDNQDSSFRAVGIASIIVAALK